MKYNREHLIQKLIAHEGMVLSVYQDSLGIDTIGIGRNLVDRGITKEELDALDIPTIGHVYEYGITEVDAVYLATNDVEIVETVRQLVLADMAFNMGVPRLRGFKKMWAAIHEGDYTTAAKEMLDSRWANQVKSRVRHQLTVQQQSSVRIKVSNMARELSEKQQKFLEVLFEDAGGDVVAAKKLAGYSETTPTTSIVKGLKEEILEATQMYMARNAPKAAMAMTGALYDPTELGIKDKMTAAKELLDRTGLIKTEKVQVEASGGVMLMPPKAIVEDDD